MAQELEWLRILAPKNKKIYGIKWIKREKHYVDIYKKKKEQKTNNNSTRFFLFVFQPDTVMLLHLFVGTHWRLGDVLSMFLSVFREDNECEKGLLPTLMRRLFVGTGSSGEVSIREEEQRGLGHCRNNELQIHKVTERGI